MRSRSNKKGRDIGHGLLCRNKKAVGSLKRSPRLQIISIHALQRWTNPFLWLFCHHQFLMLLSLLVIFFPPIRFSKVFFPLPDFEQRVKWNLQNHGSPRGARIRSYSPFGSWIRRGFSSGLRVIAVGTQGRGRSLCGCPAACRPGRPAAGKENTKAGPACQGILWFRSFLKPGKELKERVNGR